MPAETAGLRVRGLAVALGGRTVLEALDLDVAPGEIVTVEGPSGRGKSTLLRCLVRLLDPGAGTIELDGIDVSTLDARLLRRRVGLVAQQPVMLPGSVADNLRYANESATPEAQDDALRRSGLEPGFADRDAGRLSGGERSRVALARAVARDPELLLLDEPTAALDAAAAAHLAETFRALARSGRGLCVATHDLVLAERVADRRVTLA